MDVPFTKDLYDLRNRVSEKFDIEEISIEFAKKSPSLAYSDLEKQKYIFSELGSLRSKALETLKADRRNSDSSLLDSFVDLFLLCWVEFSKLDDSDIFYLPPIYLHSTQILLRTTLEGLLLREKKIILGRSDNMGHIVLGGIEGVGKSTILRALSLGIAVLFDRVMPITWVYSLNSDSIKAPIDLINEVKLLLEKDFKIGQDCEHSCESKLFGRFDKEAVLILDEFQTLFRFPDDKNHQVCKEAANQLSEFSRSQGTFGLIGGSASNMQWFLFNSGERDDPDVWRRNGYSNFNGSLYSFYYIPAIRDTQTLESFLGKRYPRWKLNHEDLKTLLIYTGGVGRMIHSFWNIVSFTELNNNSKICNHTNNSSNSNNSDDIIDAIPTEERMIRQLKHGRKICIEQSLESDGAEWFAVIIRLLIDINQGLLILRNNNDEIVGLERSAVFNYLKTLGCKTAGTIINSAIDKHGLIYYHEPNMEIQFTYPNDINLYNNLQSVSNKSLLLLTAVTLMIHGISVNDNNNNKFTIINANSGIALEEIVRNHIAQCLIEESIVFNGKDELKINNNGLLCLCRSSSSEEVVLSINFMNQLQNQHIKWKSELGLDGVIFTKDCSNNNNNNNNNIWNLHGWQCKGGRHNIQINGGVIETSIQQYKKSFLLSDVNDVNIQGIIVKASVGFCELIVAFRKTLPQLTIIPKSLTLTTTKHVNDKYKEGLEKIGNTFSIHKDIMCYYSLSRIKYLTKCKVNLCIHEGLNWFIDSLDPNLQTIAKRLLYTITSDSLSLQRVRITSSYQLGDITNKRKDNFCKIM